MMEISFVRIIGVGNFFLCILAIGSGLVFVLATGSEILMYNSSFAIIALPPPIGI